MNCIQCGEQTLEPAAKYCRRCGASLNICESEQAITRRIQDAVLWPDQPKQVIPIKKPRCLIHLSFSCYWLHEEVKLNKIKINDAEIEKELEYCSRLPGYSVFESVPLSEIRFALEKAWQKRFDNMASVRAELPARNVRFYSNLPKSGIPIDSASIQFTIAFDYCVTDFHADKNLITQTLTELPE